jgi:hypothetical protein
VCRFEELGKDVVCHQFYLTCTAYTIPRKLEGFGDFRIGGQVIRTVKYADDLVLQVKEEAVLQFMIAKLL